MELRSLEINQRRFIAFSLGVFLFSIYLLVYRGGFHSVDEVSMFAVTESLVKFGNFNTDQIAWTQWTTSQAEAQGFFGADGHVYSKKGLALSLAQAPLYGLSLHLPGLGMLQTVSILNALITAATGVLIFLFISRLGFTSITALITTLIFGLATIATVYAKYLFSEPLAAFLLLLVAYRLFAYRQESGLRHLVIAGLAAGLAVVARANNLFLLPVFGLYLLWVVFSHQKAVTKSQPVAIIFHPALITFVAAVIVPGLILLAYNATRSGNPFQTGYDLSLFSSSIWLGLYKLLFSPLRGLLIYSPILLLSFIGWWRLRKTHPAESWLLAGLVTVTVGLFSAWSSGEGLSWGSRFLVPIVPFFALCLAPIVEQVTSNNVASRKFAKSLQSETSTLKQTRPISYVLRFTFYSLLIFSLLIQILGVVINPWVYLAQIQVDFGGEFFLENTAALYDFRYSQIAGQLLNWSVINSDLAWWQPWGFDVVALGLSIGLVGLTGWVLWQSYKVTELQSSRVAKLQGTTEAKSQKISSPKHLFLLSLSLSLSLSLFTTYLLLVRYNHTDQQFGTPNTSYTQTLNRIVAETDSVQPIITVAQEHYHIPMNRFKATVPLIGFAQQSWPLPDTALPLLESTTAGERIALVTVGYQPGASNNATEQWLALNTFKISDEWLPDEVRLVYFTAIKPTDSRRIQAIFEQTIQLTEAKLLSSIPPGQPLPVEFVWHAKAQPQTNYNLFLQLLNIDGALVAQHDGPPNGGYTPTSGWTVNTPIISRHALALPPDLPTGDYRLIAGWYEPLSGQRLTTASGSDFVELGNVTITSGDVAFR